MTVSLRQTEVTDLETIKKWGRAIDSPRYMSRIFPKEYSAGGPTNSRTLAWFIIETDGRSVGTVMLEKEDENSDSAHLAMLIGLPELWGKVIGKQAINLAIPAARKTLVFSRVTLHVRKDNNRAIRCYQGCGFTTVDEGSKTGETGEVVEYFKMEIKGL